MRTTLLILMLIVSTAARIGNAQEHHKMTRQEFDRQVIELSNWGRWGKDDQLGALNLITADKRIEAAKLVRTGLSVSLARDVETTKALDNPSPFQHEMVLIGRGTTGPWSMDRISVDYHGFAHTHMDSLCHLFYQGKLYNGFSRDLVGPKGAEVLSIHNAKNGIFTRGILFDIATLRGTRFLEPGTPIYPEDLDAWETHAKVKVTSGDVIFVSTGRWAKRELAGPWNVDKDGAAGFHASCAKWLKDRDVAMIGSDGAADVIPSGIEGIAFPVHVLTLHVMGVPIFDNCDLQALCQAAEKLQRWDFLLTAAPLAIPGGTGSPLNPIATF